MGYNLLIDIASFVHLILLIAVYISYYKKFNYMLVRQRFYQILMGLSFFIVLFEVLSFIFFTTKLEFLYHMCWILHWFSLSCYYYFLYFYIRTMLIDSNAEVFKDVFFNSDGRFGTRTFMNILLAFLSIGSLFIKPVPMNETYSFFTTGGKNYFGALIFIHAFLYIIMYSKYLKSPRYKKIDFVLATTVLIMLTIIYLIQVMIVEIPILCLVFIGILVFLYYFKENVHLGMVSEMKVVKNDIERSSNAKLDFLYNMSHDIRSPMNAIVELSRGLKQIDNFDEESIKNDIKSIKFSCNNLVEIINNILDVNKIAAGKEDLQLREYNLNVLLSDLPNVLNARIGNRPIKLEFDVDQNIASSLYGDTTKIYRVIMNILTNSVKYTEVGKIRMVITMTGNEKIQTLHIKISDTGFGIKDEDFQKMFTKFNRLDSATDNAIEGTGLGLVITKKYVDSMKGKIWFESKYGAGTIFYVDLPQRVMDPTPLSSVTGNETEDFIQVINCEGKRALVVDDDNLNIIITKKMLEKYNFVVDTARTAEDCIYKAKLNSDYSIIFLDDVLSDIPGMEVVKILKKLNNVKDVPVVAYTANVMNGIKDKYLESGFDDYLPKPLSIKQFDLIIKKYCSK